MKTRITRILTPLSLVVLSMVWSVAPALAQYEPHIAHVSVPFEFTAGSKAFPAGEYTIMRTAPDRLELRDSRGRVLATLITHTVQSQGGPSHTRLEFSTANGGHALRRVWMDGDVIGNEFAPEKPAAVMAGKRGDLANAGGNK